MTNPPMSTTDTWALLERLGDLRERIVLVGGQAIHVWVDHYMRQGRVPELVPDVPYTSKDVDFYGTRAQVAELAHRIHGRAVLPTMNDATGMSGYVIYRDAHGAERQIDLVPPFGMQAAEVVAGALGVQVPGASGAQCRVMNPVHCLESRVHNVVGLPQQYHTEQGLIRILCQFCRFDPIEQRDGSYQGRCCIQVAERVAESRLDAVDRGEDLVGEVVLANVVPDGLDRVQLGAVGRQQFQVHVRGHLEIAADVRTRSVEEDDAVAPREAGADLAQEDPHRLMIHAACADQSADAARRRIDCQQRVPVFAHLLEPHSGLNARRCPARAHRADPAESRLILEQNARAKMRRSLGTQAAHELRKIF